MAVFTLEKIGVYLLIGEATQTWDCFVCKVVNSVPTWCWFIQHVQHETFSVPSALFLLMTAYKNLVVGVISEYIMSAFYEKWYKEKQNY